MGLLQHLSHSLLELSSSRLLLCVVSVIAFFIFLNTIRQYYRLRHFKGPFIAGFTKLWLARVVTQENAYLDFWKVNQHYGSIARIGPNDLVTSDPTFVKHILGVRSAYRRSEWYDAMRSHPTRNNCFSWTDEDKHSKLRSRMMAGYSGRDVDGLEATINKQILLFTKLIANYSSKGQALEFGHKSKYFSVDITSAVAFGRALGCLETDSDVHGYIQTSEPALRGAMLATVFPSIMKILASPLISSLLPSEADTFGFGRVMGIAKELAAERYGPNRKVRKDMLGSFIAHGLLQEEAESEVVLQIIAGSDTISLALSAMVFFLCSNHVAMRKLQAEISSTMIDTQVVSLDTARQMSYLQAVIKESLRMFPPAAHLGSKLTPEEGDNWNGFWIPGGTRIGVCSWGIFRNKEIFGESADNFCPERWLDINDGEKLKEMESTIDLVFSHGRYQCLGRTVALMVLNKALVQLINEFDFTICNPQSPWKIRNPGMFWVSEFWLRAQPRTDELKSRDFEIAARW